MRFTRALLVAAVLAAGLAWWLAGPDRDGFPAAERASRLEPVAGTPPTLRALGPSADSPVRPPPAPAPAPVSSETDAASEPARLVIRVLADGEAHLPAAVLVHLDGRPLAPLEYEEDLVRGEVRIPRPAADRDEHRVRLLTREHLPVETRVVADRPVVVDLVRGARIEVRHGVLPDARTSLLLARWSGGRWVAAAAPEEPSGWHQVTESLETSAFVGLPGGRYRVQETASGIASDPVDVAPGGAALVDFDLSTLVDVKGRVEAPAGAELLVAHVLVEGPSRPATDWVPPPGMHLAGPGHVESDGSFLVRARRGDLLRLTVVHPHLRADPSSPSVEAVAGRDRPVLRLADGPEIRFRIDGATWSNTPQPGVLWVNQPQVELRRLDGPPAESPLRVQPLIEDGLARVGVPEPGRWRVLVDAPGSAPLVSTVEVGAAVTDLGTLTLARGSAIRCRGAAPGYLVAALAEHPVPYRRYEGVSRLHAGGPVLRGLAAGTIRVVLQRLPDLETVAERTVVVDGVHDVEVDLGEPGASR